VVAVVPLASGQVQKRLQAHINSFVLLSRYWSCGHELFRDFSSERANVERLATTTELLKNLL
jgi:hypothetical protein